MKEKLNKIYNKTCKDYYKLLKNNLKKNKKTFIITANPEIIMHSENDQEINDIFQDKNVSVVPDGIAVVKASRMVGNDVKERITGVDIAEKLFEYCNELNKSLYLFGAKQEVIDAIKLVLKEKYRNVKLLGATNGYVKDKDAIMKKIVKLEPDVVMVALGVPSQEKIIYKYLDKFKKGIFIGVGGSFDVLSGTKKRAPKIFIKTNTEWLYRIMCEPERLKRFWNNNIKFIFKVRKENRSKINFKSKLKENWPIYLVLLVSIILHILAFKELGYDYTLNSDDLSYVYSGITFLETGKITMHGVLSAQIMPGMTFLIAAVAFIFGTGAKLWIALKVLWIIMGILSIYIVYKTIRMFTNKYISTLPCLFFLTADYLWMDNIILTETPFILFFALLIYYTLKIAKEPTWKNYILILIFYILALFIRPNIAIFPLCLFIYLLLKKYDFKLLIKQCVIAGIVLLCLIMPWAYRNYKLFGEFIPLTYGMGNPLLLGTYEGIGYPSDEELDYKTNVYDQMPETMKYYLENSEEKDYMTRYYLLEYDGLKAKYRMQEWWKKDKISMLKSYLFYKPKENVFSVFYWDEIFNIKVESILFVKKIDIILFIISSLIIILDRSKIKEWLLLMLTYGVQVALYSYTFAFSRYAITMFFMRYIVIGIGIGIVYKKIKNRSKKNESFNDNTSI